MLLSILTFGGFIFSSSAVHIHSTLGRGEGLPDIVNPIPALSGGDGDTPQIGTAHHFSSNLEGRGGLFRWGSVVFYMNTGEVACDMGVERK